MVQIGIWQRLALAVGCIFVLVAMVGLWSAIALAKNGDDSYSAQHSGTLGNGFADELRVLETPEMTAEEELFVASLALSGTVKVGAKTCSGYLLGSGFIVDGQVLTNRHMVDGATTAKLEFSDSNSNTGYPIVGSSALIDVGVVSLSIAFGTQPERHMAMVLADSNAAVSEPLLVSGHARGGKTQLEFSAVHAYADGKIYGVGGQVMLIDTPTEGGYSGGPVLNRRGEVVAMLQGFDRATGLTLAIPVETLALGLEEAMTIRQQSVGASPCR